MGESRSDVDGTSTADVGILDDEKVWFLAAGGKTIGPMTADRVRERIATGKVTPKTKAWKEGMAEWLLLSALPDFTPQGEGAPASAAATTALEALPVLPTAAPKATPKIIAPAKAAPAAVPVPVPATKPEPAPSAPEPIAETLTPPPPSAAAPSPAPEAAAPAPTPAATHSSVTTKVSRATRPSLAARSTSAQRPALRPAAASAAAPAGPGKLSSGLSGAASAFRALVPATLPLRFQQPHRIERADLWRAFGMGFRLSRVAVGVGAMVAGAVAVIVIAIGAGVASMIHYTLAIPFALALLCAAMSSALVTGAALAYQTREEVLTGHTPGFRETFAFVRARFGAIVIPPAALTFSALAPLALLVVLAYITKVPYAGPVVTGLAFGVHILLGAATLFLLVAGALAWVFGPIIVAFEETSALETVQVLLDFVKRSAVRTALWSILPSLAYTGVATLVVVAGALVVLVPLAVLAIVVGPDGMIGGLLGRGFGAGGHSSRGLDPFERRRAYADEDADRGAGGRLAFGSTGEAPSPSREPSREAPSLADRDAGPSAAPAPSSAPAADSSSEETPAAPAAPSVEEQRAKAEQAVAAAVEKAKADAEARAQAQRDAEEKRKADAQAKREAKEREKRDAAEAAAKAKAAARAAHAALPRSGFKPFPLLAADVRPLIGKTVYVEVGPMSNVRSREGGGKEVFLYTGDELAVKAIGCYGYGKEINTLDGWIIATTPSGEEITCQTIYLSLGKPLYEMRKPGTLKEFLPKVFAQGYDIPLQYADFWKRVGYDADAEKDGYERQCYETAMNHHKWLLSQLVSGRTSKTNVLGEEKYQWLWSNEELTNVFCEGMSYLDEWKDTPFFKTSEKSRDVLSTADAVQEAAGDVMMAKSELKRKYWLESLNKNAPKAQRDALDREETARCEKRSAECEKRITDNRARAEEGRADLEF